MSKVIDDLLQAICDVDDHPLVAYLRRWCEEARAFVAFAQQHATKLRKKARLAQEMNALPDFLAELAVAALLVGDRRCAVAYEQRAASGGRSPDLSITFKTHTLINVEVTRLRTLGSLSGAGPEPALKLARVVCDKLGQFPTGCANVLFVAVPSEQFDDGVAPAAMRLLEGVAQRKEDGFFRETRLDNVRSFLALRPRLSALVVRAYDDEWLPRTAVAWRNPQAKHPLAPEVERLLVT